MYDGERGREGMRVMRGGCEGGLLLRSRGQFEEQNTKANRRKGREAQISSHAEQVQHLEVTDTNEWERTHIEHALIPPVYFYMYTHEHAHV